MSNDLQLLGQQNFAPFITPQVQKILLSASRYLAQLKGVAATLPNPSILVSALGLQEAKDSSAIENIVTTHDEIYRVDLFPDLLDPAAKEVSNYRRALQVGFAAVKKSGFISINHILAVQAELEKNNAGFRKLPGTVLKDAEGKTVYTPPQDGNQVKKLMGDLEVFLNGDAPDDLDPLVKMAIAHHQFESIHPFYDGNGRTGRIVNVLYLVKEDLLDYPILYLSRNIVKTKADYYRLLQSVRDDGDWGKWIMYMLQIVEKTAVDSLKTIVNINDFIEATHNAVRSQFKFYSPALVDSLNRHPYTKIEFLERELGVSRQTATKYLEDLSGAGLLEKRRQGKWNYYINHGLLRLLAEAE